MAARKWETFDFGSKAMEGSPSDVEMRRPCSCGCDQRGGPHGVGYLIASRGGVGFNLWAQTEKEYQAMRAIFGGDP